MKAAQSDQLAYHVERLKGMDEKPPFSYLLESGTSRNVNTAIGNVSLGSCLSYQLTDFARPKVKFWFARELQTVDNPVACKGFPDLPITNEVQYCCGNIDQNWLNNLHVDCPSDLERMTVQQSLSSEWREARRFSTDIF